MKRLFCALLLAMLSSAVARAADLYSHTLTLLQGPECVGADNIVASWAQYPWNHFAILPLMMENPGTTNPVVSDAGIYTGWHTSSTFQRGRPDQLHASSIFQLECTVGGFLFDTNSQSQPSAPGPTATYGITWGIPTSVTITDPNYPPGIQPGRVYAGAPDIRPWSSTTGDPDLVIQFYARVPTFEMSGTPIPQNGTPKGQFNIDFYLLDAVSGKFFSYIISVFQNPAVPVPGAGHVAYDGQFPFVATALQADGSGGLLADYFSRSPQSRGNTSTPWPEWRFFKVHIGRQHIAKAIQDINAQRGTGLSVDPGNYLLISAGLIQEHAFDAGQRIFMGSSFSEFALYIATTAPSGTPATISLMAGNDQSRPVATAFEPLQVVVRDANGLGIANAQVTFAGPASGANVAPPSQTLSTNSAGIASAQFSANTVVGTYNVLASVAGLPPVSFTLTNTAGTPASIVFDTGNAQATTVSTVFPTPLRVLVRDGYGNAVPGATVTFAPPTSGASASLSASNSVITAADGTATVTATANATAGGYTVNATVSGVTRAAPFNLVNTVVNAPQFRGSSILNGQGAISFPAGTQSTDWLVMHLISTSPFSTPPDWTLARSTTWPTGGYYSYIFHRQAGSSSGMFLGNSGGTAMIVAYSNTSGVGNVSAFSQSAANAATITPGQLTFQNPNSLTIAFVSDRDVAVPAPPAGYASRVSRLSPGFGHGIADRFLGVGSVRGQAWSQAVSQQAIGVLVELKP